MKDDQTIFCRGCGKIVKVTDAELDAEWKLAKESYPDKETLNAINFCSKCSGVSNKEKSND